MGATISPTHGAIDAITHLGMNSTNLDNPQQSTAINRTRDGVFHLLCKSGVHAMMHWIHEANTYIQNAGTHIAEHACHLTPEQALTDTVACITADQSYKLWK